MAVVRGVGVRGGGVIWPVDTSFVCKLFNEYKVFETLQENHVPMGDKKASRV